MPSRMTRERFILRFRGPGPTPAGDVNAFASLAEVVLLEDPGARELLVEAPEDVLRRAVESLAGWDVVRERGARAGESRRRAGRTDD